jgi:hypothetical protein
MLMHDGYSKSDATVEIVSITVEPRKGHTQAEILTALKKIGAERVHVLSPTFVSAQAKFGDLAILETVARIHVRTPHEMY